MEKDEEYKRMVGLFYNVCRSCFIDRGISINDCSYWSNKIRRHILEKELWYSSLPTHNED